MSVYYIIIFVFGLLIGSFLNVCIFRIPQEKSIAFPPSHCQSCGTRLKPLDLVPVFSYLFLKGRCRYCGTGISARYPLIELLTGFIFIMLFKRFNLTFDFVLYSYLMSILIIVLFIDLDHKIIPDELVVSGLIGAAVTVVYNIFFPMPIYGSSSWWAPLLGVIPGSGFLFLIAVIGFAIYKTDDAMGMGDVKIFAPIGIFLGWKMCTIALLASILLGGIFSLFLMTVNIKKRKDTIPFGPFIVIGTFITLLWGGNILNWYISRL